MSRRFVVPLTIWLTAVLWPAAANAAVPVRPFHVDSLAAITARLCGKGPLAIALWSVDCAHCKEGLALLEKLRRQRRDVNLVLIQADTEDQAATGVRMLKRFRVSGSEQWVFADAVAERLRYAIDREWHGEVPRAYLYGPDCRRNAISGPVTAPQLREWQELFR